MTPYLNPKALIFDLDGTLLDTAPDIIAACNATLTHFGYAPLSYDKALTKVTSGMRVMLRMGITEEQLSLEIDDKIEHEYRDYFANYYIENICTYTKPFTGMLELLDELHSEGIKLAVVTNKYANMAHKLLSNFAFYDKLSLVLGCDSIQNAKPHPEPILHTLDKLEVQPYDAVYVGDHLNDIMAANRAKIHSAIALWGYGAKECGEPNSWHAHYLLASIDELRYLCLKR